MGLPYMPGASAVEALHTMPCHESSRGASFPSIQELESEADALHTMSSLEGPRVERPFSSQSAATLDRTAVLSLAMGLGAVEAAALTEVGGEDWGATPATFTGLVLADASKAEEAMGVNSAATASVHQQSSSLSADEFLSAYLQQHEQQQQQDAAIAAAPEVDFTESEETGEAAIAEVLADLEAEEAGSTSAAYSPSHSSSAGDGAAARSTTIAIDCEGAPEIGEDSILEAERLALQAVRDASAMASRASSTGTPACPVLRFSSSGSGSSGSSGSDSSGRAAGKSAEAEPSRERCSNDGLGASAEAFGSVEGALQVRGANPVVKQPPRVAGRKEMGRSNRHAESVHEELGPANTWALHDRNTIAAATAPTTPVVGLEQSAAAGAPALPQTVRSFSPPPAATAASTAAAAGHGDPDDSAVFAAASTAAEMVIAAAAQVVAAARSAGLTLPQGPWQQLLQLASAGAATAATLQLQQAHQGVAATGTVATATAATNVSPLQVVECNTAASHVGVEGVQASAAEGFGGSEMGAGWESGNVDRAGFSAEAGGDFVGKGGSRRGGRRSSAGEKEAQPGLGPKSNIHHGMQGLDDRESNEACYQQELQQQQVHQEVRQQVQPLTAAVGEQGGLGWQLYQLAEHVGQQLEVRRSLVLHGTCTSAEPQPEQQVQLQQDKPEQQLQQQEQGWQLGSHIGSDEDNEETKGLQVQAPVQQGGGEPSGVVPTMQTDAIAASLGSYDPAIVREFQELQAMVSMLQQGREGVSVLEAMLSARTSRDSGVMDSVEGVAELLQAALEVEWEVTQCELQQQQQQQQQGLEQKKQQQELQQQQEQQQQELQQQQQQEEEGEAGEGQEGGQGEEDSGGVGQSDDIPGGLIHTESGEWEQHEQHQQQQHEISQLEEEDEEVKTLEQQWQQLQEVDKWQQWHRWQLEANKGRIHQLLSPRETTSCEITWDAAGNPMQGGVLHQQPQQQLEQQHKCDYRGGGSAAGQKHREALEGQLVGEGDSAEDPLPLVGQRACQQEDMSVFEGEGSRVEVRRRLVVSTSHVGGLRLEEHVQCTKQKAGGYAEKAAAAAAAAAARQNKGKGGPQGALPGFSNKLSGRFRPAVKTALGWLGGDKTNAAAVAQVTASKGGPSIGSQSTAAAAGGGGGVGVGRNGDGIDRISSKVVNSSIGSSSGTKVFESFEDLPLHLLPTDQLFGDEDETAEGEKGGIRAFFGNKKAAVLQSTTSAAGGCSDIQGESGSSGGPSVHLRAETPPAIRRARILLASHGIAVTLKDFGK